MEKFNISWSLIRFKEETIKRYCHNCGKVAIFRDSMIKRHNANGKMIHQYAIYKCDNSHTWNQKLSYYKAHSKDTEINEVEAAGYVPPALISLVELRSKGILEVEVILEQVVGKWRLDKLLSQYLIGMSRTEIVKRINQGTILIDGVIVKSSEFVQNGQIIWINISHINL